MVLYEQDGGMLLRLVLMAAGILGATATSFKTLVPSQPLLVKVGSDGTTLAVPSNASGIPDETAFWVFEAHAQSALIRMEAPVSADKEGTTGNQVSHGRHVGMALPHRPNSTQEVRLTLLEDQRGHSSLWSSILVLARPYLVGDPVPGMCREENASGLNFVPEVGLLYDFDTIHLTLHNAGIINTTSYSCADQDDLEYTIYRRILNHKNLKEDFFLTELAETMLLAEDVRKWGSPVQDAFVRQPDGEGVRRVVFANYPGAASLFAVVVTRRASSNVAANRTAQAVYVAAATYGCILDYPGEGCANGTDFVTQAMLCKVPWTFWRAGLLLAVFLLGLFLCLQGHRFFAPAHAIYGAVAGGALGCALAEAAAGAFSTFNSHEQYFTWQVVATASGALAGGCLWVVQWMVLGYPRVSLLLPNLTAGMALAGCFLFSPALNIAAMIPSGAFWSAAFAISTAFSLPLILATPRVSSIFSSATLGAILAALPLDYAITGGALKYYLAANIIRRAADTGGDFAWAVTAFPLQTSDFELLAAACALVLLGALVQSSLSSERAANGGGSDFPLNTLNSLLPCSVPCWPGLQGASPTEDASEPDPERQPLLPRPSSGEEAGGPSGSHMEAIRAVQHYLNDRFPTDQSVSPAELAASDMSVEQRAALVRLVSTLPVRQPDFPPGNNVSPPRHSFEPSAPATTVPTSSSAGARQSVSSTAGISLLGHRVSEGTVDQASMDLASKDPFRPPI